MWNFVFLWIPARTKYLRFFGVRGRKRAPEPIKTTCITAVFTCPRKGMDFLENSEIPENSRGFHKIHEIYGISWNPMISRKSVFCRNPRPFTKRLFFLGQMDGPEPLDRPNQEINRIPLNLVKFRYFNEIMLNLGDFSRILEKISFWATWRVPGGPMLKTLIIL